MRSVSRLDISNRAFFVGLHTSVGFYVKSSAKEVVEVSNDDNETKKAVGACLFPYADLKTRKSLTRHRPDQRRAESALCCFVKA